MIMLAVFWLAGAALVLAYRQPRPTAELSSAIEICT
jgi:hypothetical protein